ARNIGLSERARRVGQTGRRSQEASECLAPASAGTHHPEASLGRGPRRSSSGEGFCQRCRPTLMLEKGGEDFVQRSFVWGDGKKLARQPGSLVEIKRAQGNDGGASDCGWAGARKAG